MTRAGAAWRSPAGLRRRLGQRLGDRLLALDRMPPRGGLLRARRCCRRAGDGRPPRVPTSSSSSPTTSATATSPRTGIRCTARRISMPWRARACGRRRRMRRRRRVHRRVRRCSRVATRSASASRRRSGRAAVADCGRASTSRCRRCCMAPATARWSSASGISATSRACGRSITGSIASSACSTATTTRTRSCRRRRSSRSGMASNGGSRSPSRRRSRPPTRRRPSASSRASAAAKQPFFLYLAHSMPHVPLAASPKWRGTTASLYGDVMAELDDSVGQVRAALAAAGVADNTIVIFTSDNGPWNAMPDRMFGRDIVKRWDHGTPGPFRGGKAGTYEGGHRVPFLAVWPGQIRPAVVADAPISIVDLFPTLARRAGLATKVPGNVDGLDIWPVLSGETSTPAERMVLYDNGGKLEAIRVGPWKLRVSAVPAAAGGASRAPGSAGGAGGCDRASCRRGAGRAVPPARRPVGAVRPVGGAAGCRHDAAREVGGGERPEVGRDRGERLLRRLPAAACRGPSAGCGELLPPACRSHVAVCPVRPSEGVCAADRRGLGPDLSLW